LLVAKRDDAHSRGLRPAGEIGNRDAGQAEDGVDAVQLQGVDDQLKAVGHGLRLRFGFQAEICHGNFPRNLAVK
jgi:hypothetical protein